MGQGGQTSGPEVSRRQEMRHDGLTKEPADTINADQSAATFVAANNARSGDQTGVWPVRGADDEFVRQGPIVNHCIATQNRYLDNHSLMAMYMKNIFHTLQKLSNFLCATVSLKKRREQLFSDIFPKSNRF